MQNKRLKNTIVLKGMASNVVEEAIVILKPNVKLRQKEYVDKNNYKESSNLTNNYIVKEAENVILNYIAKIENKKNTNNNYKKIRKYKFLQISNIVLTIITVITILIK